MEFFGVLLAGGTMFDNHRHVSVVGVVALLVPMAVGDGCLFFLSMWCCWCSLYRHFAFVTLGSWPNNVTIIIGFCRNLW
jgi:hypothetical protein